MSSIYPINGQPSVDVQVTPAQTAPPSHAGKTSSQVDEATPTRGDQISLSRAAQRMIKARNNLANREILPPADAGKEWQRLLGAASVLTSQRPAADKEIKSLESGDPDHAAIASQARAYVADSVTGGKRVANPFVGMDRISLTAIATDEAGLFTHDERDAAAREMHVQQQSWITANIQGPDVTSNFYKEAKRQYGLLSPFERSFYPPDYPEKMQQLAEQKQTEHPDPFWWMDTNTDDAASPPEILRRATTSSLANDVRDGSR